MNTEGRTGFMRGITIAAVIAILLLAAGLLAPSHALAPRADVEPNDDYDTATPIELNTDYYGWIDKEVETDYYQVTTPADGYITIKMTVPKVDHAVRWTVGVQAGKDYSDLLYRDEILAMERNEVTFQRVCVRAGTYRIYVAIGELASIYDLRVNFTATQYAEFGDNDDESAPQPIALNKRYYGSDADISSLPDQDYYQFKIKEPGYIQLVYNQSATAQPGGVGIVNPALQEKNGGSVYYDSYMDKSFVSQPIGVPAGTYRLWLSARGTDYDFTVKYTPAANWEQEPNYFGEYDDANPIKLDTDYHGSLATQPDHDFYKFTLTAKTAVSIALKFNAPGCQTIVRIYDKGQYKDYDRDFDLFDSGVTTTGKKITLPAGTYYALIEPYASDIGDGFEYTFSINTKTRADLSAAVVTGLTAKTYTGKAQVQSVKLTLNGKTLKAGTDYKVTYANNINVGTATMTIAGVGNYKGTIKKNFVIKAASVSKATVTGIKDQNYTGRALKPVPTVKLSLGGTTVTLKNGTDYTVSYRDNKEAGLATVTIRGKGNFTGSVTRNFRIVKKGLDRVSGLNRYETARAIATRFQKELGLAKLDAICVADGLNYPDALAGAYFAAQKKAPILTVNKAAPTGVDTKATITYITKNLKSGGTVYILGGPGSVPESIATSLQKAGFKVKRLAGANRYLSNLMILKEAKVKSGSEFIVCTGADFGDALSASATGRPVLLVAGSKLTAEQKTYLNAVKARRFTIVGTTKEVSAGIEAELKTYAPVTRLAGKTVYARSVAVAKKYFTGTQLHINIADGRNFPDALCGGPLALALNGPLLLTDGSAAVNRTLQAYAVSVGAKGATVFGGPASVSDTTGKVILKI